jgi:hypothetical protein
MAVYPLNVRAALQDQHTAEIEVALVTFTHASLAEPIRVSSDNTERLSMDPLRYGTVSDGETYEFILMSAIIPDDQKESLPRTSLMLSNIDASLIALMRSFTTPPASAEIALVLASAPDTVFQRFTNMTVTRVNYDESTVTLELEAFADRVSQREPFGERQTRFRFPGLQGIPAA